MTRNEIIESVLSKSLSDFPLSVKVDRLDEDYKLIYKMFLRRGLNRCFKMVKDRDRSSILFLIRK